MTKYRVRYRASDEDYVVDELQITTYNAGDWSALTTKEWKTCEYQGYKWNTQSEGKPEMVFSDLKGAVECCNRMIEGDKIYEPPCYQEQSTTKESK